MKVTKVSDYIVDFLVANKVSHIFEVCGGAITHLLDSLYKRKDVKVISMHHEQAASFAAEGYARVSGNIGVAMATSGPGATNLITGIASAYFDSIPCLFITGQVNTYEFKFNRPVRQIGFQETDIVNIVRPITKKASLVSDPEKIPSVLERAYYIANSGRQGPVLLDIPMDVQRSFIKVRPPVRIQPDKIYRANPKIPKHKIRDIAGLIFSSRRPIVLVGGGLRSAYARKGLKRFISRTTIPLVSSLMGMDRLSHDDSSFVGMIGTYGNRYANLAISNADLVLALGTRLDTRQTGTLSSSFARGADIVHVDIDPHELGNKIKRGYEIHADAGEFLENLNGFIEAYDPNTIGPWKQKIGYYKTMYPAFQQGNKEMDPNHILHKLSSLVSDDAVFCVDVGQNQMWAAQSLYLKGTRQFLTQGGMGAMGSSLAMAIGASFANPRKQIIVITGDGGFQLNIQELETIRHHNLPIKIILFNNGCYGMVRQFQEQYFDKRFQSTEIGYSAPDFQKVVSAYGIEALRICDISDIGSGLKAFLWKKKPGFIEFLIDKRKQVYPKLAVNKPLEEQDPALSRRELKSNMFIKLFRPETKR